jgi:carboxyl-terminal processing protease
VLILFSSSFTFYFTSSYYDKREKQILDYYSDKAIFEKEEGEQLQRLTPFVPLFPILNLIEKYYVEDADYDKLLEGAKSGILSSLDDPYSMYLTNQEVKNMMIETQGSFGGIGIQISTDTEGRIVVIAPIEGTPGQRQGIMSGDRILMVNDVDLRGMTQDEAVKLMRGEPGTRVILTILRGTETIRFDIIRELIKLTTIRKEVINHDIGYIRLSFFDANISMDLFNAIDNLKTKNIKGLILDLRDNPGGLLSAAIEVSDILLPETLVVYTEGKNKERKQEYYSNKGNIEIPYVILVNGGSASASEIVAGAVKDTNNGTLVGTRTFGKGSVQTLFPLAHGDGVKLTIAKYYTPSGVSIHSVGIEPHFTVDLPEGKTLYTIKREEDTQLKKAIEVLMEKIKNP